MRLEEGFTLAVGVVVSPIRATCPIRRCQREIIRHSNRRDGPDTRRGLSVGGGVETASTLPRRRFS